MYHLVISPSGVLRCQNIAGATTVDEALLKSVVSVFTTEGQGAGLFALGALKRDIPLAAVTNFWHEFAADYVTQLCHTPASAGTIEPIDPPAHADLSRLYLSVPPMVGTEYVTIDSLQAQWHAMDDWVRGAVADVGGLSAFIAQHAPHWHQVGRVCFHLAENKDDPEFPFAFMVSYASGLTKTGRLRYLPLARALQEYAGAKNKKALVKLLTPVSAAAKCSAFVKELVDSGDIYHPYPLTAGEAYRFLTEVTSYEEAGLLVRLPDWWKKRPRARASVKIGQSSQGIFGTDALLDFDVSLAVGDETLTPSEVEALLAQGDGLQFIKGQWVEVDREKLEQALSHWRAIKEGAGDGVDLIQGMRLLAGAGADLRLPDDDEAVVDWSAVHAGDWLQDTLLNLRSPEMLKAAQPGKALKATLRHYQSDGVKWLWTLQELGLGACLADDMGLGKTIQVISLLLMLKKKKAGPSLVIVPASLLANWQNEIAKFAPSLRCLLLHTSQMDRKDLDKFVLNAGDAANDFDVVITTYAMAARLEGIREANWHLLILDEAQAIKNPSSKQTRAIKKISARSRIAMTGTPVENRLSDLWSLFDFLNPGLLGSARRFKEFIKSLEKQEHVGYAPLRNLVSPYILRRLKTDKRVIADLPDKTEVKAFCRLSKPQAAVYQQCVTQMKRKLDTVEGIERRGLVLSYLMRFKQICNHPSQLNGDALYEPSHSGKFKRLQELCEEIASRQEKLLVFTQFREMTAPLAEFLGDCFGQPGLVLHGGTPVKKRESLVEQFQHEDGPPFFVLSLKAGGTGLTLTAANHVIHFDRWWNPAVENQATDRAFRIGQKRNVLVHKFIVQGTLEEKIDALIEEKTKLSEEILEGGGETMLTEMSNEDLLNLVSLDIG